MRDMQLNKYLDHASKKADGFFVPNGQAGISQEIKMALLGTTYLTGLAPLLSS